MSSKPKKGKSTKAKPPSIDPLTGLAFNGRPTAYDPKYCDMLLKHARKAITGGGSFESFALTIGVHPDTLDNWARTYEAFGAAKKFAKIIQQTELEKMGLKGMQGKGGKFAPAVWIFWMKARFGWSESGPREQEDGDLEFED